MRAEGMDDLGGAVRQAGVHRERRVGAAEHFFDEAAQRGGRAAATPFGVSRELLPTGLVQALPRLAEPVGRDDLSILELAPLRIALGVQRPAHLAHPAVTFREGRLALVRPPRVVRRLAEELADAELLEEQELALAQVGLVTVA